MLRNKRTAQTAQFTGRALVEEKSPDAYNKRNHRLTITRPYPRHVRGVYPGLHGQGYYALCRWFGCKVTKLNSIAQMKMTEFIKIMTPALKMLSQNGLYLDDWKYVDAYERYRHMRSLGIKQRECIRMIAEEMNVSRRTVERAIKRLTKEC